MATEFGKRLKTAREHAGLTQEQLAERAGIAQSTLAAAEATGFGSRRSPQIAAACGVNANWLASGEGEMLEGVVAAATRRDPALRLANAFADLEEEFPDGSTKMALYNELMGLMRARAKGTRIEEPGLLPEPTATLPKAARKPRGKVRGRS